MSLRVLYLVTLTVVGALSQNNPVNKLRKKNTKTLAPQCFHEGRWFPAGTIISAGRSMDWCYGSFCDTSGKVRHWDNYNCPPPDKNNPNPPFPNVLFPSQDKQIPKITTTTTTTTPVPVTMPQTTKPPIFWFPTTTTVPFVNNMANSMCFYRNNFYWAGQDIENRRLGNRCFGTYCDFNARIQHWQDNCRNVLTPPAPSQRSLDIT